MLAPLLLVARGVLRVNFTAVTSRMLYRVPPLESTRRSNDKNTFLGIQTEEYNLKHELN